MEKIDLSEVAFSPELLGTVPPDIAQFYETVPVRFARDGVVLAMAPIRVVQGVSDQLDSLRTELQFVLGRPVEFALADRDQIRAFVGKLYGRSI